MDGVLASVVAAIGTQGVAFVAPNTPLQQALPSIKAPARPEKQPSASSSSGAVFGVAVLSIAVGATARRAQTSARSSTIACQAARKSKASQATPASKARASTGLRGGPRSDVAVLEKKKAKEDEIKVATTPAQEVELAEARTQRLMKAATGSKFSDGVDKTSVYPEQTFASGLIGGEGAFATSPYNFDPLGVTEKFPSMLPLLRESELKHGRIAMLGFVGLLAPNFGTFPFLPESCSQAGAGQELLMIEAHDACAAEPYGLLPLSPLGLILFGAGFIELTTTALKVILPGWGCTLENAGDHPGRKEIGAFLDQLPKSDDKMRIIKLQELKNGRLAMLAFSGAITQGALTANSFPWWW